MRGVRGCFEVTRKGTKTDVHAQTHEVCKDTRGKSCKMEFVSYFLKTKSVYVRVRACTRSERQVHTTTRVQESLEGSAADC